MLYSTTILLQQEIIIHMTTKTSKSIIYQGQVVGLKAVKLLVETQMVNKMLIIIYQGQVVGQDQVVGLKAVKLLIVNKMLM